MKNIQNIYQERASEFAESAETLQRKYNYYSIVRLLTFFLGIFLAIFLFNKWNVWIGLLFLVIFFFCFVRFIFWHRAIAERAKHLRYLSTINQEELDALNHQYQHFDSGAAFVEVAHPYTIDLDIFGDYSLFQYLNRCATSIGRKQLATYLAETTTTSEILARQAAIEELKEQLDWRQNLQAYGRETVDNPEHLRLLRLWLADEPYVSTNKWLIAALYFVPLWMIVGIGLSIYWMSWQVFIFFVLLPGIILSRNATKVNETHQRTANAEKMLSSYSKSVSYTHLTLPTILLV